MNNGLEGWMCRRCKKRGGANGSVMTPEARIQAGRPEIVTISDEGESGSIVGQVPKVRTSVSSETPLETIEILSDDDLLTLSPRPSQAKPIPSTTSPSIVSPVPSDIAIAIRKRPAQQASQEHSHNSEKRIRIDSPDGQMCHKEPVAIPSFKTPMKATTVRPSGTEIGLNGSPSSKFPLDLSTLSLGPRANAEPDLVRTARPPSPKRVSISGSSVFHLPNLPLQHPTRTPLFLPSASPSPRPLRIPSKVAGNAKSRTPLFMPFISSSPAPSRRDRASSSPDLRAAVVPIVNDEDEDEEERELRFTESQEPHDLHTVFDKTKAQRIQDRFGGGESERHMLQRIGQLQGGAVTIESADAISSNRHVRDDMDELYATESEDEGGSRSITEPSTTRITGVTQTKPPAVVPVVRPSTTFKLNPIIPLLIAEQKIKSDISLEKATETGPRRNRKAHAQKTKKRKRGLRFCVFGLTEIGKGSTTVQYPSINGPPQ
ncbi:hypothetical protein NEOLEDRAFT_1133827 [Neolentinus lepideus HHB14362 ss-1]|uniref:Uncharacterized protein n=1 Tax=Neolentinus lepideus HHB14362 ss-1 TaxID=1314782 RepID=A0A165SNV8_9AGAM|nr:hypothetical protein NEOLEDRAFT_1133827 [Neolentinus lepideus HHB14362 ss-1]